MKYLTKKTSVIALLIAIFAVAVFAAANYQLFGDAELFSPGNNSPTAAQLRSTAGGFGGADFTITSGLTFADITNLSSEFKITSGACGAGSPRFQVKVVDAVTELTKNVFVYFGSHPNYNDCPVGTWTTTGDLLEAGKYVDSSQLTGGTFYHSYSDAVAAFGTWEVTGVQLVVDNGNVTVLADNVPINNTIFTFESANSCKNGGWQNFTSAPGPFTNQGQCVSYYAKGGQ